MRFAALVVLSAAAFLTFAGCGESVPQSADGAFFVATIQPDPLKCQISGHTAQVGAVDATERKTVIIDGAMGAVVNCEVINAKAPFNAHGKLDDLANSGNYLEINIPSISPDATIDAPAEGTLTFSAGFTAGNPYSGSCKFYFEGKGSVAAGRIWVSFQCDALTSGMSTCPLKQGYAIFENCLTEAIPDE
jgi:hypothetical protein